MVAVHPYAEKGTQIYCFFCPLPCGLVVPPSRARALFVVHEDVLQGLDEDTGGKECLIFSAYRFEKALHAGCVEWAQRRASNGVLYFVV